MDYLEQKGIRYTIVVKLYPWIQMELVGVKYRDRAGGISVGEMRYIGIGWQAPRLMWLSESRLGAIVWIT